MNKKWLIFAMMFCVLFSAPLVSRSEEDLFEKAKLQLFDRKWEQAAETLERFVNMYPNSRYYPMALFYQGKCFEEQESIHKALAAYNDFLKISRNSNLKEEATVSVIDLSFNLYQKGDDSYLERIVSHLNSKYRTLRYYSAFKLSYAKGKKVASKAVPVLKALIAEEDDEELIDRAKIALMRIQPELLKDISEKGSSQDRLMHFQVYDKKLKKVTFSLTIPFMFARLALESIPGKSKSKLKREGYDLDRLIKNLIDKGKLIKIDDGDSSLSIWID